MDVDVLLCSLVGSVHSSDGCCVIVATPTSLHREDALFHVSRVRESQINVPTPTLWPLECTERLIRERSWVNTY